MSAAIDWDTVAAMVSSTLSEELATRRRDAFVGRASERELFDAALTDDSPSFSVLWILGPGGVGKSSLLDALAHSARSAGASVVRIDAGDLVHGQTAVPANRRDASEPRTVLLVDAFDGATDEDWFREVWLPQLPAPTLTVVASREPPSVSWRSDPAWRDLLRVVSLRNLGPTDARRYLSRSGVAPGLHEEILDVSYGHPLALSLLTDLAVRGDAGKEGPMAWTPDLVAVLVRRFVDSVPSDEQRRALEVCAIARVTTEDLLRDALQLEDGRAVFEWLRDQSFIRSGPAGLWPHDLARDVLDADLRWRDPATYKAVFRRVRGHIHRRLDTLSGAEQQSAIADEKFVFRNLPSVLSPVDWHSWGNVHPVAARPEDRAPIMAMVAQHEGSASAQIAEEWWERQPDAFHVIRDAGGAARGFLALVVLNDPSAGDLAFDPGARAAAEYSSLNAPVREGEVMTQTRFVIDRDGYQAPSPTLNAAPVLTLQHYLRRANQSWDFLTLFEPDPLDDYFAIADLPRCAGADFVVGGRRHGLFAHDFRRLPVDAWLELVTERALAQDPVVPPAATQETIVMSHAAFTDAVRQALRDLHRLDQLARNPLTQARVVLDRVSEEGEAGPLLARLLHDAIGALGSDPRDAKRWRAVDRTYLRPAPTQERAAEVLDLPFSTYRRHLVEGVDRIVARLWDLELDRHPAAT